MSTATLPLPTSLAPPVPVPTAPTVSPSRVPHRRLWTCEDLYRFREMSDAWFGGMRFFLIDGEIYEMPAPGPRHDMSVTLTNYWCLKVFAAGYVVRVQMGLPLGINTDPIPDLSVVIGTARGLTTQPTTAELVVEVSDTTLSNDLGVKAYIYAAAGIRDFWVIDVEHRRLFLFRDPRPEPAATYGYAYADQKTLGPNDTIAPLAAPQATVTVAELLP
jgi:Uma2 family endonuclease